MQIKNLSLQNFRNYGNEKFSFSDGLNILFGKNAQERPAVPRRCFIWPGTSLRIRRDKQLIRIEDAAGFPPSENRYGR
ncbi:MAG: hypothetical protein ACLRSW_17610 [Christensenellaceae bacterium]